MKTAKRRAVRLSILLVVLASSTARLSTAHATPLPESRIRVDGSSTVFPISEAAADEFHLRYPERRVTVGISGTTSGFEKLLAGEADIIDASRSISAAEMAKAEELGIEFIEIPIARDGITLVVNPENHWTDSLSLDELRRIWRSGSEVGSWKDVRASWPDRPLHLYGPGPQSGTYDYFSRSILANQTVRSDYTASEDDTVLVRGIGDDPNALGFFGYSYYERNSSRLKAVAIDAGNGPVTPSVATIAANIYRPLSRALFLYVRLAAAERPEVDSFVRFYLENGYVFAKQSGYAPLPRQAYDLCLERFERRETGRRSRGGTTGEPDRLEALLRSGRNGAN